MNYPAIRPAEYGPGGLRYEMRDVGYWPRISIVAIDFDDHRIEFYEAGDDAIRVADVADAVLDFELIEGMAPADAMRLALEFARKHYM